GPEWTPVEAGSHGNRLPHRSARSGRACPASDASDPCVRPTWARTDGSVVKLVLDLGEAALEVVHALAETPLLAFAELIAPFEVLRFQGVCRAQHEGVAREGVKVLELLVDLV